MRGGALRLYEPGQRGRGLGGVIKKAAVYLGQRYLLPYLKKKVTRKALKTLRSLKRRLPSQATKTKRRKMMQRGGALKGRRRPQRRQKRKAYRDIFKY